MSNDYYVYRILAEQEELHRGVGTGTGMYAPIHRAKEGRKTELYDRIRAAIQAGKEVTAERVANFEDYHQALKNLDIPASQVVPTHTRDGKIFYRRRFKIIKEV